MLTSKDLMIGNWFAFQGHPYKCTASDIEALAECEEKGVPTDISEIPLTAEILEKNGFRHGDGIEKRWYNMKIEDKKVTLYQSNTFYSLKIDEGIWPKLNNIYIHFVHELQNALRLCGIEKEIEL